MQDLWIYPTKVAQWLWELVHDKDWMLVIFTGFLAISTFWLWRTTRKDTRILQRAYIAVEPLGIHQMSSGDRLIGHIGIKNAGNLPTRSLGWFIDIKFSDDGDEHSFPVGNPDGNIVITPGTISTRGSSQGILVQALLTACGADTNKGREAEKQTYVYVWGIVRYEDGFRRKRFTKFCHRYNWVMRDKGVTYEISKEFARYHEYGNDAD
jgi:hypothetical protein